MRRLVCWPAGIRAQVFWTPAFAGGMTVRTLGRQTAHEVAHALAVLGEAAFEFGELGIAVGTDAAAIGRVHLVGLGPPLALVAGRHTRDLEIAAQGPIAQLLARL